MSLKRWNAKRDTTEPAICLALKHVGADYLQLDKFDLLVLFRGQLYMLDAKTPRGKGPKGARGRTTSTQDALLKRGWPLHMVVDEQSALKAIGAIK